MGYYYRYDDLMRLYQNSLCLLAQASEDIQALDKTATNFNTIPDFQGKGAEAIKAYVSEVHGMLIAGLGTAMAACLTQLCAYKRDMFAQDNEVSAEFREDFLTDVSLAYGRDLARFRALDDELDGIVSSVDDLISQRGPTNTAAIEESYRRAWTQPGEAKVRVGTADHRHRNDVIDVNVMIARLTSLLDHAGVGRGFTYTDFKTGDLGTSAAGRDFVDLLNKMNTALNQTDPQLEVALSEDIGKYYEPAVARVLDGVYKVTAGVGLLAFGIGAIAASGGAATPLVIGGLSAAMGLAEAIEGGQDIYHGLNDDTWNKAYNFIRDPLKIDPFWYDMISGVVAVVGPLSLARFGRLAAASADAASTPEKLAVGYGERFGHLLPRANPETLKEFSLGKISFEQAKPELIKAYAYNARFVKGWSWNDIIDRPLSQSQQRLIRHEAKDLGVFQPVVFKDGDSLHPDWEATGAIATHSITGKPVVLELPRYLWGKSDAVQSEYLNKLLVGGVMPDGYTWHHSEIPGRMELVQTGIHNSTYHRGGRATGCWAELWSRKRIRISRIR